MSDRVYFNIDDLMQEIRAKTQARGAIGIRGIGRLFRIADDDGSQTIDLHNELPKLLGDIGVLLNKTQIEELGRILDRSGDGLISYDEFLYFLAPPMNEKRLNAVVRAFDFVDKNQNGTLEIADIALMHPQEERTQSRQAAKMSSATDIFTNLIKCFDKNGDGTISKQEFIDYYREMSPNIDSDDHFVQLIEQAWGVPPEGSK